MRRIEISNQVRGFLRTCAPEPRQQLRRALKELQHERGDIKPLEGRLKNYFRLRVGNYRVIFRYATRGKNIDAIFAERRELIYEIFEKLVHSRLLGRESE